MPITDDLAASSLFDHLPIREVDRLGRQCREAVFEPGEILIALGDVQDAFQIIVDGQVSVTRPVGGQLREVARLGTGTFVGEMAMLTDEPASATVTALVRTRVIDVPRSVIDAIARRESIDTLFHRIVKRRQATNRLDKVAPLQVAETKDGPVLLRPLWPDDWRLMQASRDRVSDDALRQRFFTLPKLHEGFLRRLTNVDLVDQFAWALINDDGRALAGVGRYARQFDTPDTAEIALLVADELQGKGLGGILLTALAATAEAHEITSFTATALAENHAVQRLLERYGATWSPGDRGQEVQTTWPAADILRHSTDEAMIASLRQASHEILDD